MHSLMPQEEELVYMIIRLGAIEIRKKIVHYDTSAGKCSFPNMYRSAPFDTTCGKFDFEHTLFADRVKKLTIRTECRTNSYTINNCR